MVVAGGEAAAWAVRVRDVGGVGQGQSQGQGVCVDVCVWGGVQRPEHSVHSALTHQPPTTNRQQPTRSAPPPPVSGLGLTVYSSSCPTRWCTPSWLSCPTWRWGWGGWGGSVVLALAGRSVLEEVCVGNGSMGPTHQHSVVWCGHLLVLRTRIRAKPSHPGWICMTHLITPVSRPPVPLSPTVPPTHTMSPPPSTRPPPTPHTPPYPLPGSRRGPGGWRWPAPWAQTSLASPLVSPPA